MASTRGIAIARFVNVRPPQRVEEVEKHVVKRLMPPADFKGIVQGDDSEKSRDEMRTLAKKVLTSLGDKGADHPLVRAVRTALRSSQTTAKEAMKSVEAVVGEELPGFVASKAFRELRDAAWRRLYAQLVLGVGDDGAADVIRSTAAAELLVSMDSDARVVTWSEVLTWRPVVPKGLFPRQAAKQVEADPAAAQVKRKVKELGDRLKTLEGIEAKLTLQDRNYFRVGAGAKADLRPITDLRGERLPTMVRDPRAPALDEDTAVVGELMEEPGNWLLDELAQGSSSSVFTQAEQRVLNAHRAQLMAVAEADAPTILRDELYQEAVGLFSGLDVTVPLDAEVLAEAKSLWEGLAVPAMHRWPKGSASAAAASADLPRVHVLGIGDLIVVEEQVDRYELGEVAHIENVMAKETRQRTHVRVVETETSARTQTEKSTVEERSLQTTDRSELSQQTEKKLETSLTLSAGAQVSAGYGPVSVSANAGMTSSTSASSSTQSAATLARTAVEKAASTVAESILEEQSRRVLNRVEETNEHGFANDTVDHISGVYRWVDKYYRVRAVNYGRRLMLEMIVPEPANSFLHARGMHAEEEMIPPPPPPIKFGPKAVTRSNYLDYAGTYGATDIPAPPPNVVHVTLTYGTAGDGSFRHHVISDQTIEIPDGYRATNVWRASWVTFPKGQDYTSHHLAGSRLVSGNTTLPDVMGTLQLSSKMKAISFHVGWRVRCELTTQAFQEWQVAAWASLKRASEQRIADYEERMAARAIGRGVHIHGSNPGLNKEIMRNELKRAAIRYLSEDMGELHVGGVTRNDEIFDSADATGGFDLQEARLEGLIIQFFEQAFEWHNMTWAFYPYFWANKARHHEKMLTDDPDPAMRAFLAAGAARVVVPVPTDYEDAVLNFFETNEIWSGGEPPLIDDPTYISIVEELKAGRTSSFDQPMEYEGAGTPPPFIIDEWEVKLPTTLVKLDGNGELPEFPASARGGADE